MRLCIPTSWLWNLFLVIIAVKSLRFLFYVLHVHTENQLRTFLSVLYIHPREKQLCSYIHVF